MRTRRGRGDARVKRNREKIDSNGKMFSGSGFYSFITQTQALVHYEFNSVVSCLVNSNTQTHIGMNT